ncbi:argininosuccinate synthase [Aminobacter anthyllidis]|uniref:argininosuccinate synthase n=1 Tax=Aminobacter anthyllidis TaxID=1035067 RepID=A0A9X1AH68_9HYPH|nr:argininosuccinate synthase [Aminobacter anthyllidis]MBT1159875.1 argininosuccinate synthase [Aminobacter anthyllidis]
MDNRLFGNSTPPLADYVLNAANAPRGMSYLLLYSGGLDTSCCIKYIRDELNGTVLALTCDVGQVENFDEIGGKAVTLGAEYLFKDVKSDFYARYISKAIRLNARYFDGHPLASSLSRQIVSDCAVEIAKERNLAVIAHGATGRGNDSFRFDNAILSRLEGVKILAPIRNNQLDRDREIAFAQKHNIPVSATRENPYSIDENMWGREIEAGPLDDLSFPLPREALAWVKLQPSPSGQARVSIEFEGGLPVRFEFSDENGRAEVTDIVKAIMTLNTFAGSHGIGLYDHLEERASGVKVREIHESPAATLIIRAHQMLEHASLTSIELATKRYLETRWIQSMVSGRVDPVVYCIDEFAEVASRRISGGVTFKIAASHCFIESLRPVYGLDFHSMYGGDKDVGYNQDLVAPAIELMDGPTRQALRNHRMASSIMRD